MLECQTSVNKDQTPGTSQAQVWAFRVNFKHVQSTRLELLAALHLLQLMFIANGASSGKAGPKVALSEFYSAPLCQTADLAEEYALWVRQKVRDGLCG